MLQEIEKVQKQPMHFSLAQNDIKCIHSCSKVWFGLSTEVCTSISTPVFLIVPLIHVSQFQSTPFAVVLVTRLSLCRRISGQIVSFSQSRRLYFIHVFHRC